MRRRQKHAAFSLFSFQDIVTSVTAIVILIMLLLCVDFVRRKRAEAAANPAVTEKKMTSSLADLASLEKLLREQLEEARSNRQPRSKESLDDELRALQARREKLLQRLVETQVTREVVRAERSKADAQERQSEEDVMLIEQLSSQAEEDRRNTEILESANDAERIRQQQRMDEQKNAPRQDTVLVFNPLADGSRRTWLVEFSGQGIVVLQLGGGSKRDLGSSLAEGTPLSEWITLLRANADYCLILQRPSADKSLLDSVEQALTSAAVEYGIDLIGEEQTVRDGAQGTP